MISKIIFLIFCVVILQIYGNETTQKLANENMIEEMIKNVQETIKIHINISKYFENKGSENNNNNNNFERTQKFSTRDSSIKSMPVSGYVKWGRTHCNSTNNPQNLYTFKNNYAHLVVVNYINDVLGGLLLNGERYLIQDYNYDDGANCGTMIALYEYMYQTFNVSFFFAPTNPDCSILAKYAEYREILYGNGADYSLLILERTPNATTAFDSFYTFAQDISYNDLQWTYMSMNDPTTGGESCGEALTNPKYIDQSKVKSGQAPAKVRTAVFASNNAEVPYLAQQQQQQLELKNVTILMPYQDLNLDEIESQTCNYLDPTIFNEWKKLNPDLAFFVTGASNSSIGFTCMQSLKYEPGIVMNPVAFDDNTVQPWQLEGLVVELPFLTTFDYSDPIFGNYSTYANYFQSLFNYTPSFYELTISLAPVLLLDCIFNRAKTFDKYKIRDCIRSYNGSTIFGQITLNPNGWYLDRPNVCAQLKNGTLRVAYPENIPNRENLQVPFDFIFNQTFLNSLNPKRHLGTTPLALIITFSIIGLAIIVAVIAFLIFRRKYVTIVLPKKETEWEMEN